MSKNKIAKYKITDTNIDKEIIGKQVTVERVKSKGVPTTKTRAKAPTWFVEFEKRNNQRLDRIENNVSSLKRDVNTLKSNLNRVIKLNNLKH